MLGHLPMPRAIFVLPCFPIVLRILVGLGIVRLGMRFPSVTRTCSPVRLADGAFQLRLFVDTLATRTAPRV